MKKSILITLLLVFSLGTINLVYANNQNLQDAVEIQFTDTTNEFEIYTIYQDYSVDELIDNGLTREDAIKIKNNSFEDIVMERASLPESTLQNMGYSSKDIEVLKAYDGEKLTADSEVVTRAAAKCTGSIRPMFCSGSGTDRKITFRYTWLWDKCPLVTAADSSAVSWFAYNTSGDLKKSSENAKTASVTYVDFASGAKTVKAVSPYRQVGDAASKVLVGVDYPMRIDNNTTGGKWAKQGEIQVQVTTNGLNYIMDSLDVAGKVGHLTLGTGSITADIKLSSNLMDIISFIPSEMVDDVAKSSCEIKFEG